MISNPYSVKSASDLLLIEPFKTRTYEDIPLTSLTAYVIYWLDIWEIPTSLESIAVGSHRIFPAKFCMVGWPQFPDVNRTNRSILQMRPKYRNLATSASDKGVFLSESGIREAKALIDKLGPPMIAGGHRVDMSQITASRGTSRARTLHPEDKIAKVRRSKLFDVYLTKGLDEAQAIHLIGMLAVYDHTPSKEKRRILKQLTDQAKAISDEEILDFLAAVQERFSRYLNR